MEQLKQLYYSTSFGHSKSNSFKVLTWKFYDKDNFLRNLEYKYTEYNISKLNRDTMRKEDIQEHSECFIISSQDNRHSEYIKNIDEWLQENHKYLIQSNDNYKKSLEIIKFIKSELSDYNYATTYEVGWSVKDFYKLYIDLYSSVVTLNYKGKETKLSEQKLKTFIQKNKKLIMQAKENEYKKYLQRKQATLEQERIKKLAEETERLSIDKSKYDATRKVNYGNNRKDMTHSFAVPRTLKQRYEAQACKPFPEKYPWHSK